MSKNKIPRKPVGELLRLACSWAEQDRRGFADAYAHMRDDPEVKKVYDEALADAEQLKEYRQRRWGESGGDRLDRQLKEAPMMTTDEIAAKMDNVVNGRAAYYDKARKFRTWSVDFTAHMEKSKCAEPDLSKPRKMRRAK